jgi:hypothetical protein
MTGTTLYDFAIGDALLDDLVRKSFTSIWSMDRDGGCSARVVLGSILLHECNSSSDVGSCTDWLKTVYSSGFCVEWSGVFVGCRREVED